MKAIIYTRNRSSYGARVLARHFRTRRRYPNVVDYLPRNTNVLVNWGCSQDPNWNIWRRVPGVNMLNNTVAVGAAVNKLNALELFADNDVPTVEFTTDQNTALAWNTPFFARTKLRASKADGCYYIDDPAQLNNIPNRIQLFTKYFKRKHEYRIHVFNGEPILIQHKRRRRDHDINNEIRNHANGWIYAVNDIVAPPQNILDASIAAVNALGLDFGAVDVIYNEHYNQPAVLEVNTAPGLDGESSINAYTSAIEGTV